MVLISPSILSADFGNLRQEVKKLADSGLDTFRCYGRSFCAEFNFWSAGD